MEVAAAEIIWKGSIKNNQMKYSRMLSDGDAKTSLHLSNVSPYPVTKEECINHISKRMTTGLNNLIKTYRARKKSLGGRKMGALTSNTITVLSSYYRNAIAKNLDSVEQIKRAINTSLLHYTSTDKKSCHHECPVGKNSWCFYNKSLAKGEQPKTHENMSVVLNQEVFKALKPLYKRLSDEELLKRCTRGGTQNANESLHSLIWRTCPKEIFVSKKKVELAVLSAVSDKGSTRDAGPGFG